MRVIERFRSDGEREVTSVLRDLVTNGLVFATGDGANLCYGITSDHMQAQVLRARDLEAIVHLIWLKVFQGVGTRAELARSLGLTEDEVSTALDELQASGRVQWQDEKWCTRHVHIPMGAVAGTEAAILDHFRAVCNVLISRSRASMQPTEPTSSKPTRPGEGAQRFASPFIRDTRTSKRSLHFSSELANRLNACGKPSPRTIGNANPTHWSAMLHFIVVRLPPPQTRERRIKVYRAAHEIGRTRAILWATRRCAVVLLWVGVCGMVACASKSDPGGDSATHFWETCDQDEQCGANYQCLCGRCSEYRDRNTDCSAKQAVCVAAADLPQCSIEVNLCAAQTAIDARVDAGGTDTSTQAASTSTADDSVSQGNDETQSTDVALNSDAGTTASSDSQGADNNSASESTTDAGTPSSLWGPILGIETSDSFAFAPVVTLDAEGNPLPLGL